MAQAVKCPVCKGSGNLRKMNFMKGKLKNNPCHGCDSKGWVEIENGYAYSSIDNDTFTVSWPMESKAK